MQQETCQKGLVIRKNIQKMLDCFPTAKEMIVGMSHAVMEKKYRHIRTPQAAYETNYITLSEMKSLYSPESPVMLIETWIMQLALFLDLPIGKDQIKELAWLIYDDNHYLNIAEITLVFTRIKKGYYGQFFGRIDPVEIQRWFREYRNERGIYISKLP